MNDFTKVYLINFSGGIEVNEKQIVIESLEGLQSELEDEFEKLVSAAGKIQTLVSAIESASGVKIATRSDMEVYENVLEKAEDSAYLMYRTIDSAIGELLPTWEPIPLEDRNARLTCTLEGLCPDCGNDLTLVSVGGIPDFLENEVEARPLPEDGIVERNEWKVIEGDPMNAGDTVGCLQFDCKGSCDVLVEVYKYRCGDWVI
jgi:hypothetical protein